MGKNVEKVSTLDIKMICPLHGPILKENLEQMKDITIIEPVISIRTTLSEENEKQMRKLSKEILREN